LWESRQDLNHAQAIGQTGSWRMDVQRNELHWSDENHRIFGSPKGTPMTYETFLSVVHPDDRDYVDRKWQAALRGELYDIEHRVIVAGQVKWVRERAELEFGKNGLLLGGFGATQDVTDQKRNELLLAESRQRYAGIIESAMDAMITIDANQRILVFNAAAEKMFGCTEDEAIGGSVERFIPERFRPAHNSHIRAFGHTGSISRKMGMLGDIMGLRANGDEFPIEASISYCEINGEKSFTAILRDITERIQAELTLKERLKLQDQLTKVAATVPGVICSFRLRPDGSGSMPYASPVFESVYGFSHEIIAEDFSPVFARIHPDDINHINETIAESARTLQPWQDTFRYNHPIKGEIWIEGHSMPQREMDGSVLWHGYIQDITDRKRAETALHDRENELRLIMDATPALISYLDADFRYLRVNKTYENWFCMAQDSILGHEAWEIVGERAWNIVQPYLERVLAGERINFDQQIPYGTGNPRWVNASYIPDKDSTGTVKGIVAHIIDIEERKLAEEALRENEVQIRLATERHLHELQVHKIDLDMQNEELRQASIALETSRSHYMELYDFAPVGYLTLTTESMIAEINLTGTKLLGMERNKLINRHFAQFIADEHKDHWHQFYVRAKQQDGKQSIELPIRRKDGTSLFVHLDCQYMKADDTLSQLR
uniref:PAS domain-containing protein n=1 Tax=Crenothrix polyspora TaxID=360316 RepID=UPI0011786B2B